MADGSVLFNKLQFQWIPKLDADTTNPVYLIDMDSFETIVLKGANIPQSGSGSAACQALETRRSTAATTSRPGSGKKQARQIPIIMITG